MSDESKNVELVDDPEVIARRKQIAQAVDDAMCEVGADDIEYLDTISGMLVCDLIRRGVTRETLLERMGECYDVFIAEMRASGPKVMS